MSILEVKGLKKYFPIKGGFLRRTVNNLKALDDVSFILEPGKTLGIVGESGCGKSTLGRTIVRLYEPSAGQIIFNGKDISASSRAELKPLRRDFQMIFQDPYSSLNPRMTVYNILREPLNTHSVGTPAERDKKIKDLIDFVGLRTSQLNRYPHEFSGGQRQRISIARALTLNPKLIVADEPVSALDVSVQSQVLNLISDLQKEFGISFLFIAHDLAVVQHISDEVGVMYLGKMVEKASAEQLYSSPKHPYTKALLSAIPHPDPKKQKERIKLTGEVPSPINPPKGCPFHTRCPVATDLCKIEKPISKEVEVGHTVSCHLV